MTEVRLPRFEDAIVRADAWWFKEHGFISEDMYQRVLGWLEGTPDNEAQETVSAWMERDADWVSRVEPAALSYFWYVAPVVKLESILSKRMLLRRANELSKKTRRVRGEGVN